MKLNLSRQDCLFGAAFKPLSASSKVFDNTPAALDGTLAAGDEITGVNGKPVKGKTKVEVAKMIQAVQVLECCKTILQGNFSLDYVRLCYVNCSPTPPPVYSVLLLVPYKLKVPNPALKNLQILTLFCPAGLFKLRIFQQ